MFKLRENIHLVSIFFTIAEDSYSITACEITHNMTKHNVCTDECSNCKLFNIVSPTSLIDLHHIQKFNEFKMGELVYDDLDVCE